MARTGADWRGLARTGAEWREVALSGADQIWTALIDPSDGGNGVGLIGGAAPVF